MKNKNIIIDTLDGDLYLPRSIENKHMLVMGATGAGKTQLISQMIEGIRARGDRALILDLKGDYTSWFFDPRTDFILNPMDTRSAGWSIKNDINMDLLQAESEVIANALISDLNSQSENEKFFLQAGKNVAKGLILFAFASGKTKNKDINEVIFGSDYEGIKTKLKAVGAYDGLSALGDKRTAQADGVLATLHTWARAIDLLKGADGDFSISNWIKNGKGFIFLNASQKYEKIINPLSRFFIDFFLNVLLGTGQDLERRVWVILDEFQNINAIPSLINILTLGRSAGASIILGSQDFGMVDLRYGQNAKTTIMNAMNSLFLFRVNEPNTADYLSRTLGESEIEDYSTSSNLSMDESWDKVNIQANRRQERLLLPLEIAKLEDLEFACKIKNFVTKKLKLKLKIRAVKNPAFLPVSQKIVLQEPGADAGMQDKVKEKEEVKENDFGSMF